MCNVQLCKIKHVNQGHESVKTWTRKLNKQGKSLFDLDRCV